VKGKSITNVFDFMIYSSKLIIELFVVKRKKEEKTVFETENKSFLMKLK
jgi:hypothetical protein